MPPSTRRNFLKQSGVGLAGMSLAPVDGLAALAGANAISPPSGYVVPGVHGYAEQCVAAGEKINFRISSTVSHRLSVYRLRLDPESPDLDELLHRFADSARHPQPISPGSYMEVATN